MGTPSMTKMTFHKIALACTGIQVLEAMPKNSIRKLLEAKKTK